MELIDRPGAAEGVGGGAALHPLCILPRVGEIPHHRGRARRKLGAERVRIALVDGMTAVARDYVVLIEGARANTFQHALPDARGILARAQPRSAAPPVIEIADDRYGAGVRRPHRKAGSARGVLARR